MLHKFTLLIAAAMGFAASAAAHDELVLTFNTSGTSTPTVNASIDGVTATVKSMTHNQFAKAPDKVLCPEVNGNTSPNITVTLEVNSLPEGWKFNNLGLHIHALNKEGGYQQHDGHVRKWDVTFSANETKATYNQIEIAAGVPIVDNKIHSLWTTSCSNTSKPAGSEPMLITLNISAKAATNDGCYFGLSEIRLSFDGTEVEPDPIDPTLPTDTKRYYIRLCNDDLYIARLNNGDLGVSRVMDYASQWTFIPTEKAHCYYIRNMLTGEYFGSCNYEVNHDLYIHTDPTEIYVGSTTYSEVAGCYWFSSTDCENYNDETKSPLAYNNQAGNALVVTYYAGKNTNGSVRTNSYWQIIEVIDTDPEVHSKFLVDRGIYVTPCGINTANARYIKQATIGDELHYPMHKVLATEGLYQPEYIDKNRYELFTQDVAHVHLGQTNVPMTLKLNQDPSANTKVWIYIDWNGDGVFEYSQKIDAAAYMETTFNVPEEAKLGETRLRVRVTENDFAEADDPVNGQAVDFLLNILPEDETWDHIVNVNDPNRGEATYENKVATATSKNDGIFLYWRDNNRPASTALTYEPASSLKPRVITAMFAANPANDVNVGIRELLAKEACGSIVLEGNTAKAVASATTLQVLAYALDGTLAAKGSDAAILPTHGVYIIKAITTEGTITAKIIY